MFTAAVCMSSVFSRHHMRFSFNVLPWCVLALHGYRTFCKTTKKIKSSSDFFWTVVSNYKAFMTKYSSTYWRVELLWTGPWFVFCSSQSQEASCLLPLVMNSPSLRLMQWLLYQRGGLSLCCGGLQIEKLSRSCRYCPQTWRRYWGCRKRFWSRSRYRMFEA